MSGLCSLSNMPAPKQASRKASRSTATEHAPARSLSSMHSSSSTEEQRRGTATQHAIDHREEQRRALLHREEQRRGTATEHAPARSSKRQRSESPSPLRQSGPQQASSRTATEHATSLSLTANEATRVAQEETLAERRDDSLEHLVFKLAEFLSELLRAHCWTESDAEDIVYAQIEEWSQAAQSDHCFGEAGLLVHKKMYDVLTRDK